MTYEYKLKASKSKVCEETYYLVSPEELYETCKRVIGNHEDITESFNVLYTNAKCKIIGWSNIAKGGSSQCQVEIKSLMQHALLSNAHAIIIEHNHPSGDTKPSDADVKLTRQVQAACKVMGIAMLDHIIISDESYYSFKEHDNL